MRKVGKILGRSFLVLVLFTSLAFAPKEPVDRGITFDPAHLGDDLDAYLAPHEAKFSDIIPTTQKEIVWAGDKGAKAPSFTIPICSIPDDHIDPRRSAFFMARSVLRDIRNGGANACSTT
jgi:hypothetical protein